MTNPERNNAAVDENTENPEASESPEDAARPESEPREGDLFDQPDNPDSDVTTETETEAEAEAEAEAEMANATDAVEQEAVEVAEPAPAGAVMTSPGQLLRQAREAAGWSVEDLVAETKLTRTAIQALESDQFSGLPKPVYVRGYYKKCAHVLKADDAPIISAYTAMAGEEKIPEPVSFTLPPNKAADFGGTKRGSGFSSLLVILFFGAIVGGAAFWYLKGAGKEEAPKQDSEMLEMPLGQSDGDAVPVQSAALTELLRDPQSAGSSTTDASTVEAAEATSEAVADTEAEEVAVEETAAASDEASAEATPSAASGSGDLLISFEQACWTDIRDNEGERLLFGLIEAGTSHRVGGAHPYRILLGNPEGVKVVFEGEVVDLGQHTRANKTAVFSLGD